MLNLYSDTTKKGEGLAVLIGMSALIGTFLILLFVMKAYSTFDEIEQETITDPAYSEEQPSSDLP